MKNWGGEGVIARRLPRAAHFTNARFCVQQTLDASGFGDRGFPAFCAFAEAIALADRVIVFEPRPGRIKMEVKVPFARPRSVEDLQGDPEYHELYRHLWNAMASHPPKA